MNLGDTTLIFTFDGKITTFSAGSNLLLSTKHSIQGKDLFEFVEIKQNFIALIKETNKLAAYSVSKQGDYQSWRFQEMDTFLRLYRRKITENPYSFILEPQGTISFVFDDGQIMGIDSRFYLDQPIMALIHKDDHLGLFGILKLNDNSKITVRWKYFTENSQSVYSLACEYRWIELVTISHGKTRLVIPKELFPAPITINRRISHPLSFVNYLERYVPVHLIPSRYNLITLLKYWQSNVMNFKLFLENTVFKASNVNPQRNVNVTGKEIIVKTRPSYIVSLAHNTLNMLFDWIALKPIFK